MATVHLDEDLVKAMEPDGAPLDRLAQELIVLELYRRAKVSSGKAAEILVMERIDFIKYSGQLGIPFIDMTTEEWDAEQARIDAWIAGR